MADTKSLLVEIGVEELPSSFVDAALAALPEIVTTRLAALRVGHGAVKVFGTPRRLAVRVEGVAVAQQDLDEEVVGPPESAAFKDGKPTKAAEAFAAKLGIDVSALKVVEKGASGKQKAGRYVVGRRAEKGQPTRELLGPAVTEICTAIPFRKSMRWGEGHATFGRPVQWLVVLFGKDVVDTTFAGVRSGRTSRGHRFLAPGAVQIDAPETYEKQLAAAHVQVDRQAREDLMMKRVAEAARALGGEHDPDPYLVDENASLVEEPHVVTGAFDKAFLALPPAVIRSVARGHQKYFCVQKNEDELFPHYLAVVNTANRPDLIAKGNDRVMRARLSDARFFFDEDRKVKLEARLAKLAGIVFQHRLGTVLEKVERVEKLAGTIAGRLGLTAAAKADVTTAARLAKADLVSLMVGEFPELQGHMGRAYALQEGLSPAVADAIRDHYRPVGATDAVAPTDVSAVVALADRLDTLVGCFAVGLSPTGAADPYALRRACIALLRTLMEAPKTAPYAKLRVGELFADAYDLFAGKKLDLSKADAVAKLEEFATERLRGLLANRTSNAVADAVLAGTAYVDGKEHPIVTYPAYALEKALVLAGVVERKEPWLDKARLVMKRLSGIGKDEAPVAPGKAKLSGAVAAKAEADKTIVALVERIAKSTEALVEERAVRGALEGMEVAATKLDEIFNTILVNDPEDADTKVRLGVLSYGARCILRVADFARLT